MQVGIVVILFFISPWSITGFFGSVNESTKLLSRSETPSFPNTDSKFTHIRTKRHQICDCYRFQSYYCGHDSRIKECVSDQPDYDPNDVYYCSNNKASLSRKCAFCKNIFIDRADLIFDAECICESNSICGNVLQKENLATNQNETLDVHTLYWCPRRQGAAEVREKCPGRCEKDRCLCQPDQEYCGHELIEFGWNGLRETANIERGIIYRCETETHVRPTETCRGICTYRNQRATCIQGCIPGYHYCGHEINQLEGWSGYPQNGLYNCTDDKTVAKETLCGGNCVTSPDMESHCEGD